MKKSYKKFFALVLTMTLALALVPPIAISMTSVYADTVATRDSRISMLVHVHQLVPGWGSDMTENELQQLMATANIPFPSPSASCTRDTCMCLTVGPQPETHFFFCSIGLGQATDEYERLLGVDRLNWSSSTGARVVFYIDGVEQDRIYTASTGGPFPATWANISHEVQVGQPLPRQIGLRLDYVPGHDVSAEKITFGFDYFRGYNLAELDYRLYQLRSGIMSFLILPNATRTVSTALVPPPPPQAQSTNVYETVDFRIDGAITQGDWYDTPNLTRVDAYVIQARSQATFTWAEHVSGDGDYEIRGLLSRLILPDNISFWEYIGAYPYGRNLAATDGGHLVHLPFTHDPIVLTDGVYLAWCTCCAISATYILVGEHQTATANTPIEISFWAMQYEGTSQNPEWGTWDWGAIPNIEITIYANGVAQSPRVITDGIANDMFYGNIPIPSEITARIALPAGYILHAYRFWIGGRYDGFEPIIPATSNVINLTNMVATNLNNFAVYLDIRQGTTFASVANPTTLATITDTTTAVQAVQNALTAATPTDLQTGQLELFIEHAIARAAQIQSGYNIQISQATVSQAETIALQTLSAIETMLQQNGYQPLRTLRPTITFVTDFVQLSIEIDPSTINSSIEQFIVQTPTAALTFSSAFIEYEVQTSPMTVTIRASNSYEVTFDRPPVMPVRLTLPCDDDSDYMAIRGRNTGEVVGGQRNPLTEKREAPINQNDIYEIVVNRVDFTDIQHLSSEAQRAIRRLAAQGRITGVGDGLFAPDAAINRAQMASLITSMLNIHDPNANSPFLDVLREDWFFGAAGSAYRHRLMRGMGGNLFSPHLILPRDQLTALSARVLRTRMGYRTPTNPNAVLQIFVDRNEFSSWSIDDLALATQVNLVIRRADGMFMPRSSMTRGDAALVLYRLYMRLW